MRPEYFKMCNFIALWRFACTGFVLFVASRKPFNLFQPVRQDDAALQFLHRFLDPQQPLADFQFRWFLPDGQDHDCAYGRVSEFLLVSQDYSR